MAKVRFSPRRVAAMCKQLGTSLPRLRRAVIAVGRGGLNARYAEGWSKRNPFHGYCYRVCETLMRAGKVPRGFRLQRGGSKDDRHYFFRAENGEILDPTALQFGRRGFDYSRSKGAGLQVRTSNGARALARELGWRLGKHEARGSNARARRT